MEDKLGTKAELERIGNPSKNDKVDRFSFYTSVSFLLDERRIVVPIKIDTGSPYTIIGIDNISKEQLRRNILNNVSKSKAYDASGTVLNLKECIVDEFKLCDKIVIPKMKLCFCNEIGKIAVLGMDILSLFTFTYYSKDRSFWLHNYEKVISDIEKRTLNKDIDYIDPQLIASIDENKDFRITYQDLEANYVWTVLIKNNKDFLID